MTSWLRLLVVAGLVFGFVMTGLGWLAHWFPLFDVFNNAVPAIAAGAVGLMVLALVAGDWLLILAAALLAAINVLLFLAGSRAHQPKPRRAPSASSAWSR